MRAFTLIETLVSVAVVALLVGLVLPGLSKARSAARDAACVAALDSAATAWAAYHWTYRDVPQGWEDFAGVPAPKCPQARGQWPDPPEYGIREFPDVPSRRVLDEGWDWEVWIVHDRTPWHAPDGRGVGFLDGHAAIVREEVDG